MSEDFRIGGNFSNDPGIPIGTDVTGAGLPDLVVGEWTGGAHCCFTLHVFELGKRFRVVGKIEADDSDGAQFIDLEHDGKYVFEGNDWVFAYWGTSFVNSPAPDIFLRYLDGRFRLATDLMKKPEPSADEFAALVDEVRNDQWDLTDTTRPCGELKFCRIPVSLWRNMLKLLYIGHADLAWRLLDKAWRLSPQRKQAFANGFCKQLSQSHYWNDLHVWAGSCPGKD